MPAIIKCVKSHLFFIALLCGLSACVQSSGKYGIDIEPPAAVVSHSRARVGEAVTITLRSNLGIDEGSELANNTFFDVRLGACFTEGTPEVSRGGFCGNGGMPLQPWIVVLGGNGYVTDFGDVRLGRGETYPLEATFTFTATEAKAMVVNPWIDFDTTALSGPWGGISAGVTFE